MRKFFQIIFGAALCIAIAAWFNSWTSVSIVHEAEPPPDFTWREVALILLLAAFTQWIAHLVFGWFESRRKQDSDS